MGYKRLLLLTALICSFFTAVAQIEVESFNPLPNDMTATNLRGRKIDQNGKVCALIKVVTTETDFTFDGGSLGIVETALKPGEIWVWVPEGLRRITISHPEYEVLRDYYLNYNIESGRTYEMRLKTPKKQEQQLQILLSTCTLEVKSDKAGDEVYINDSLSGVTPLSIKLRSGVYTVRVKRGDIEDTQSVVIDKEVYKPLNFKFTRSIDIKTDRNGDIIFVDGQRVGYSPRTVELSYGKHIVRGERDRGSKYEEQEITVERTGGETDIYLFLLTEQEHFTKESIVFATLNFGAGFFDLSDLVYPQVYFQKSYGFTVGSVKKVGWYFSLMTNFDSRARKATEAEYLPYSGNSHGDFVDGVYPFYSDESCGTRFSVMAGLLVKTGSRSCFRLGAGYGRRAFAFSDTGGDWIRPARYDKKGLDLALGMQYNNHNHTVFSFDLVSTAFSTIEARVGIGFCMQTKKLINFE